MSLKKRRVFCLSIVVFILALAPISVFQNLSIEEIKTNRILFLNFLQRVSGQWSFSLLFFQILLGSNMQYWAKILGALSYRLHIVFGIISYSLILFHPSLYYLIDYQTLGTIPLTIPSNPVLLGVFAFWMITFSVFSAYFRTKKILRRKWRWVHYLNYLAFVLVAVHAYFAGSDINTLPFYLTYWFFVTTFIVILILRVKRVLILNIGESYAK